MSYQARNANRAKAHFADTPRWEVDRDTERGPVFCTLPTVPGEHGFSTVNVLQRFCEVNNIQVEWADEYGEPGYTTPAKGILFSNWNNVPQPLQDRLEAQGYELEWSDEWYVDCDNSPAKAWRETSDSHGWESRVRALDGYMLTPDSDSQKWIDSSLNEEDVPLPSWFDASELERRGFAKSATGHDPGNTLRSVFREFTKEGYDVILVNARSYEYDVWTRREAKRELFLSDTRGVYIPRDFATCIDRARVSGIDMSETLDELTKGPALESYWDIWDDVLDMAVITDEKGIAWRLEQDGDLWLVETAGEWCEFEGKYYVHKK